MININGKTIFGKSISINNNKIIIDGEDVTPDSKEISIKVEGNIEKLSVDACNQVTVTGDVGKINTMSGDVDVTGNVTGNIETMSGDVHCGNVGGKIKTMTGDIRTK